MRQYLLRAVVATCLLFCAGLPVQAQSVSPPSVALTLKGRLNNPRSIGMAELQAMPATTVEVSHTGHNGAQTNRYTGVLLWTLLKAAEPIDENGPRTHLQHTIRATGQDGYSVVLAIGEIEPDFEGKQVLVAYAQDGQALTSLKLVVPADAKAGRSVRDLVAIDVN